MADKCVILCADHRCKHTYPSHGYGICHHPDHENLPVYCGIDRMYMETCPRCAPIPPNIVRGVGKKSIIHGSAGSGKSYLTQFEDHSDLLEQGIVPVTSLLSGEFKFTADDILHDIEHFKSAIEQLKCKTLLEATYPPFTWDEPGFSLHSEEENHG